MAENIKDSRLLKAIGEVIERYKEDGGELQFCVIACTDIDDDPEQGNILLSIHGDRKYLDACVTAGTVALKKGKEGGKVTSDEVYGELKESFGGDGMTGKGGSA